MLQGYLATDTKLQFSGHETFPLRYGWLKKVHDAVRKCEKSGIDTKTIFKPDDAIAYFGVGKNMVVSMRYWALAAGIISDTRHHLGSYESTPLARKMLDDDGWDPWLENPNSLWLIHWHLASTATRTSTWHWVFNHFPHASFDRTLLVEHLSQLCASREMKKVANSTLKRDVECFVRTYVDKGISEWKEDTLECPLTELALLRVKGNGDGYHLARGYKSTLSAAVFAFATVHFWQISHPTVRTLSLNSLFHEPGSPGRIFLLNEESVVDLAIQIDSMTDGAITWSETAGLRQLICHSALSEIDQNLILSGAFKDAERRAA